MPGVRRIEYLVAFLASHRNNRIDEELALKAVQRQLYHLELEKAKALGRQRPRTHKGVATVKECQIMASQLGLVDEYLTLLPAAHLVLDPTQRRFTLMEKIWTAYSRFSEVVLRARDASFLELPFYDWDDVANNPENPISGLHLNRWTFEMIRDLATQLELLNWCPIENDRQIVYPVAQVVTQIELFCISGLEIENSTSAQKQSTLVGEQFALLSFDNGQYLFRPNEQPKDLGYTILQTDTDRVYVRSHAVPVEEFEQKLWENYLELSSMRAQFPVLYPSLRNMVCRKLRISDQTFDLQLLGLLKKPQHLIIYPSGGTLNYAANLAHLAKFLPPKTSQGNFIVYLKMARRSTS